jgi:hypothetical protein
MLLIFGTLVKMQTFSHLHLSDGLPMGDSHFQFRGPFCVVENQATQTGYLVQSVYIKKSLICAYFHYMIAFRKIIGRYMTTH